MIEISTSNMIAICIASMAFGINIEHFIIWIFKYVIMKGGE